MKKNFIEYNIMQGSIRLHSVTFDQIEDDDGNKSDKEVENWMSKTGYDPKKVKAVAVRTLRTRDVES